MSLTLFKNGFCVFGAGLAASIFSLIRNVIIARLLGPENYGVGAVFVLVLTFLDMVSNLSLDRQVVQSRKGGDQSFIDNIHFAELVKGILLCLLMYLCAPLYVDLLGVKDTQWAFELLSLVPLIRGFRSWGVAVEQRDSKFTSTVYIEIWPQLLALCIVWPLSYYVHDYTIFIYVVFCQALVLVVTSHVVTKVLYSVKYNREYAKDILSFGWPLLLNGFLMYFFLQGDRLIVSRYYGMEALGLFSAAFSLSIMPVMVFGKVFNTVFLPLLSKPSGEREKYAALLLYLCAIVAIFYAVFMYFSGAYLYEAVYGEDYIEGAYLLSLIGVIHGFRIFRSAPAVLATSCAKTKSILYSNIIRFSGFALAFYFSVNGYSIDYIVYSAGLGELLAIFYQLFVVKYFDRFVLKTTRIFFVFFVFLLVVFGLAFFISSFPDSILDMFFYVFFMFFLFVFFVFFYVRFLSRYVLD